MVLCIILFFLLVVYRKRISEKRIWYILFFCNVISSLLFILAGIRDENLEQIARNSYGEGQKTETFLVSVEGELEEKEITVEIQEQSYTEKELQEIFSKVMDELDQIILGENESKDRITKNLVLPTLVDDYPIEIRWEMDRYDIVGNDGTLIAENLPEEGTLLELRGILMYQEKEAVYVTTARVFPEIQSGEEKWISEVQESFKEQEEKTREEEAVALPVSVNGKSVSWRSKPDGRGYVILCLGVCVAGLLLFQKRQDEKEAEMKMRRQMMLDYPEIISKFALLLGTGMTVKNTWKKIVQTYEEEKVSGKNRFAYEEMCLTVREMQGGISEQEAYERFGKRCKLSSYMKFSMLLSQNLRKGSKGLSELLKMESMQALEQRKSQAKKRGEEASTKLLLPMFLMFTIVLIIVMIPAFLSIKL